MLKLHNSLTRKLEDFKPAEEGQVKLYSCGPTVYDFAQIGNLRAFVFVDTLRRALGLFGYEVKHVMNITDVGHLVSDMDEGEDKLEKGAVREGKTVWEVAEFYTNAFENDVKALNILPPNGYSGKQGTYAKATDFIDEQVNMIKLLIEKGYAYQTDEAIYFDVTKLPSYGELSGQKLADKEVGARSDVVTDDNKHHPQDFALWFFLVGRFKNHTMHWDSPWGAGFPGWHIECSAIIHTTLDEPIDIHTGGVDHIGTHHTNEIAQTQGAFGKKLANYWLHNEFVLIDDQKMSKSLNNFYTLKDITSKGYDPLALRLLFLQVHYRSQMNFTWGSLDAAAANLKDIYDWADLKYQVTDMKEKTDIQLNEFREKLKNAIAADLNTAIALAEVNKLISTVHPNDNILNILDDVFGLKLGDRSDITDSQKHLIQEREKARDSHDWLKSDELRDELLTKGLEIKDTNNGPVWSRV